ncbi:hypothetical protein ACQKGO_25585 [Corallococcus interemptor]|uniref:hypothetical protein n=1 Tax=Corallococcus interemptor TaxID=2316720 RepID=UPI003CFBE0EB
MQVPLCFIQLPPRPLGLAGKLLEGQCKKTRDVRSPSWIVVAQFLGATQSPVDSAQRFASEVGRGLALATIAHRMGTTGAEVALGASIRRAPGKLHGPEVLLGTSTGRRCASGNLHGARVVLGTGHLYSPRW